MVKVKIKKLINDARIPKYAHEGDAGMDIYSSEDKTILPGERVTVSTGIAMEFPKGYVALIWDKSGMANNFGIKVMGGVLEHTYRGEYMIILLNTSKELYQIKKHQKIAQVLIQPIETAEIEEIENLSETIRGEGRFGSTGMN
jgi:dUTP pyrophosphatase